MQLLNCFRFFLSTATITVALGGLDTIAKAQESSLLDRIEQLAAEDNQARFAQERQRFAKDFTGLKLSSPVSLKVAQDVIKKLAEVSRSKDVSISTSVNAALLLGELKHSDDAQITATIKILTELVSDETVEPAVRVAAFNGLAARISTATVKQQATILEIFTKLAVLDESALPTLSRNWIHERLLEAAKPLINRLGEDKSAIDRLKEATIKLLSDDSRPVNLRVRSLILVAAMSRSGVTLSAAELQSIGEQATVVAIAAVKEDFDAIERTKLQEQLSGSGPQAGMPADEQMTGETHYLSEAACLQMSWRLVSMANAIDSIANQLEDEKEKEAFKKHVVTWRTLGIDVYETPDDTAAIAAIKKLIPDAAATLDAKEFGNSRDNTFSPFQLR